MTHWTPHPELLVSRTAADYLSRKPATVLTEKQVRRAVQVAHDVKGLIPASLTVAQLRVLFTAPPDWLLDHHRTLIAKGVATARHEVVLEDGAEPPRPRETPEPPPVQRRRTPQQAPGNAPRTARPSAPLIPVFREPTL
ncbi:hypothetical protein ACFPM3_21800 [Streptomyces coeruleoprunus]|uniref:Uncharacterized protein n=1 Tax=Streptomyces coeruleoprunus TaxID=285563 RepID=A0ABV9XKS1_9ACTN